MLENRSMPASALALRLLLAFALIANALPSAAGMAMAIGLAPCAHGPTAATHDEAEHPGHGHHCDDHAKPGKAPVPPCCADGKCQCGAIGTAAVLVAVLPALPHAHPAPAPAAPPVALTPPVPTELLRPPIA